MNSSQQKPSEQQQQQQKQQQQEQGDLVMNPTMIGNMAPTHQLDTVAFTSSGNVNAVHTREVATSLQQLRVVSDAHHTVEQMLSRRILFEISCDFSDTLVEFGFLDQWLKNPMVKTLLAPYAMFTGTYCVSAVMNSQPTQSGMALLAASPQKTELNIGGHVSRNVPLKDFGAYPKQLVPFYSGLQNVLINLASSSESVLRVPYVGSRAMNEVSQLIDTTFVYTNICQLRSGSTGEKLPVQFYGWMEDLVLYGTSSGEPTVMSHVGVSSAQVSNPEPPTPTSPFLRRDFVAYAFRVSASEPKKYSIKNGAEQVLLSTDSVDEAVRYYRENFLKLAGAVMLPYGRSSTEEGEFASKFPENPTEKLDLTEAQVDANSQNSTGFIIPQYSTTKASIEGWGYVIGVLRGTDPSVKVVWNDSLRISFKSMCKKTTARRAFFQSGKSKMREGRIPIEPVSKEEGNVGKEADTKGLKISSIADAVSSVAGFAAKIPAVADFAIPVQWAANAVADTARFFGFSKPHVVEPEKPVAQRPFYHFAHGSGASTANKLSVNPDQAIQTVPLGPEGKDEMSISYLVGRPGLYFNLLWTTNNKRGDCLFQDPMIPSRFFISQWYSVANVSNKGLVRFNTHMSYLSELFMYYVGSLMLTLNLGATKFHSGRLRMVFVPQMPLPTEANDSWKKEILAKVYQEQNKNYHMVMDVRDAMTFTFKTPFEPGQPVVPTELSQCVTVPAFFVFVEIPLVRSANVSDTVEGWFSVSGGSGFRFVGPKLPGTTKLLPFGKGVLSSPSTVARAVFQGWDNDSMTRTETSSLAPAITDMSGGANELSGALHAQTMTVGDVVESLRLLMKRPSETLFVEGVSQAYFNFWNPWFNTTQTGEKYESETFFQRVRSLFRFSTGGIIVSGIGGDQSGTRRFKLADLSNMSYYNFIFKATGHGANGYTIANTQGDVYKRMSEVPHVCESLHRQEIEGMWSYEIPYYNQYDKTDNMLVWSNGNGTSFDYSAQCAPPVSLVWITDSNKIQSLYISAAEDFNCGYLNGPPITFERASVA